MRTVTLWGQEITQLCPYPDIWEYTVNRAILREGEPPRCGINQRIIEFLAKRRATLKVHCLDPECTTEYDITPRFVKKCKKEKLASKFEGGKAMVIFTPKL